MKTSNIKKWAALLTVSGLSLITPLTVTAQTALTVSGSAYTETGATHTTGNVNTAGSYTGSDIRFTGALTVSGSSAFTADTGTFAAITGTNHAALTLVSSTASGAVNILDRSALTLNSSTFNSTLTLGGTSTGTLTGSRVVGATTVRENSKLTVSGGTLAAVTASTAALLDLADAQTGNITFNNTALSGTLTVNNSFLGTVTGSNLVSVSVTGGTTNTITLRESQKLSVSSGSFNAVYLYNTAATPGTLTVTSATAAAVTGSNLTHTQITDSKTANVIVNNSALSGTLAVNNSALGTVTGSNLASLTLQNSAAGNIATPDVALFRVNSSTVTGYLYQRNTAAVTGTLLLDNSTVTNGISIYNNALTEITSSTVSGASTVNSLGAPGTLTVNNSVLGTVTGSNLTGASFAGGTANTITLRETESVSVSGGTFNQVYLYNTAATPGTLAITSATTAAVTGSNLTHTQITDSKTANVIVNNSALSGTLTVNNSALGTVTGSNLTGASFAGGTANTITLRETESVSVSGGTFNQVYLYNTAATPGTLAITSATTAAVTGSNLTHTQITDSKTANVIVNNSALSGTLTVNNSLLGTVTGSNLVSATFNITSGSVGAITMRETQNLSVSGGTFASVYLYNTDALRGTLTVTDAVTTGAVSGSHALVTVRDSITGGASVSGSLAALAYTSATSRGTLSASNQATLLAQNFVIDADGSGMSLSGSATGTVSNFYIDAGKSMNYHAVGMSGSATLTLTSGTILTTGANANGFNLSSGAQVFLEDLDVDVWGNSFYMTGSAVAVANRVNITSHTGRFWSRGGSAIYFTSGTINQGYITADTHSLVDVRDSLINTLIHISGTSVGIFERDIQTSPDRNAKLINVTTSSTLSMSDSSITAVTGSDAWGAMLSGSSVGELINTQVTVSGKDLYLLDSSTLTVSGGTLAAQGDLGNAAVLDGLPGNLLELRGVTVSADANGLVLSGSGDLAGGQAVIVSGGTLTAAQNAIVINQQTPRADGTLPDLATISGTEITYHVSITGGATVSGSLFLEAASLYTGTDAAGDETTVDKHTVATVSADGASQLTGDVIIRDTAVVTLTLSNHSTLTGKSAVADTAALNVSLNNNANWRMTGRSWVTTLHGANGGTITIDNVEGEDLIVKGSGGHSGITGETKLNLTLSDAVKGDQEIWVVVDESNKMTGERFKLGNEVSYGMYQYELVNATDGAWLVYTGSSGTTPPPIDPPVVPPIVPPVPSGPPTISSEGDVIINTAAAVSGFWFTQLDNLHKRMGELRYNKPAGGDVLDNIWIRGYGQQINANTGIRSVNGFGETQYGVDLGTDHLWKLDADNQLYTGVFAGYGGAEREFHTATHYNGSTDSGYGGVYTTWINKDGWYADLVAKSQYFRNEFSGEDRAGYDSIGAGISLEVGNMFEFKDGWFVEPSAQFSYLHLMNDDYTTRDGMHVDLSDADVLHIYGGARFGRNIKLTNSGQLQPYIKAGGLGQISSGNKVTVSGDHWRPNLDGARAVVGAGVVWQLDADSQLHLDYEASFGEKYDKPWGVNFGYRYQF